MERINFLLKKDLADRIPKENLERRNFLNNAVEHELEGSSAAATLLGKIGGSRTSEKKTAAVRENAKKPRPRKHNEE